MGGAVGGKGAEQGVGGNADLPGGGVRSGSCPPWWKSGSGIEVFTQQGARFLFHNSEKTTWPDQVHAGQDVVARA